MSIALSWQLFKTYLSGWVVSLGTALGLSAASAQNTTLANCQDVFPSAPATASAAGGVKRLSLPLDRWNCATGAQSQVDWVSVSVLPPGTNDPPAFEYAVQPNLRSHSRTGAITASGQTFTIEQEAGPQAGIAGPASMAWVLHEKDKDPAKRILRVSSDDPDLNFTAAPSKRTEAWLQLKSTGEKGSFETTIAWRSLKPGLYAGEILVHAAGARNDPLQIPVSLKILPEAH